MDYTFLRNNFYLDFLPLLAGEDGVIRGPAGDGVVAAVAREDVARSAVTVLRDPALHVGRTYDLTGPEDISLARAAEILTAGNRPDHHLPQRNSGGGLRLPGLVRCAAVAGGRLGEHLHGDRRRRTGRADVGRARAHRAGPAGPGGVPGSKPHAARRAAVPAGSGPAVDGLRGCGVNLNAGSTGQRLAASEQNRSRHAEADLQTRLLENTASGREARAASRRTHHGPLTAEELQLAVRNHSMPLEALRQDITPPGLHYVLTHFDIPFIDADALAPADRRRRGACRGAEPRSAHAGTRPSPCRSPLSAPATAAPCSGPGR